MNTDSVPLLVVDQGQDEEGGGGGEQPDFKKMVFFHGKVSHGCTCVAVSIQFVLAFDHNHVCILYNDSKIIILSQFATNRISSLVKVCLFCGI